MRLKESLGNCAEVALGTGIFDWFYAVERLGIWNQKLARSHGAMQRVSPYYSRVAAVAMLRLPHPPAWTNRVHETLIRTALPNCLDIPFNGETKLWHHGSGNFAAFVHDAIILRGKVERRLRSKLNMQKKQLADPRNSRLIEMVSTLVGQKGERAEKCSPANLASREGIKAALAQRGPLHWEELGARMHIAICTEVANWVRKQGTSA
jgi:hypothetical protein